MKTTKVRLLGAGAAVALAASLTACGSAGNTAANSGTGTSAGAASTGTSASGATSGASGASGSSTSGTSGTSGATGATSGASGSTTSMTDFGSACSAVPSSGPGSFSGMTTAAVATAASHNPVLSTLVTAVKKAGLVDTLNNAKGITVFAPANSAFAAIPKSTLDSVLANKSELTSLLEYHVVSGRLGPSELAGTHKTLAGPTLKVTGSGTDFTVNGNAKVVCGNVRTANATVYIISKVLMPPTSSSSGTSGS